MSLTQTPSQSPSIHPTAVSLLYVDKISVYCCPSSTAYSNEYLHSTLLCLWHRPHHNHHQFIHLFLQLQWVCCLLIIYLHIVCPSSTAYYNECMDFTLMSLTQTPSQSPSIHPSIPPTAVSLLSVVNISVYWMSQFFSFLWWIFAFHSCLWHRLHHNHHLSIRLFLQLQWVCCMLIIYLYIEFLGSTAFSDEYLHSTLLSLTQTPSQSLPAFTQPSTKPSVGPPMDAPIKPSSQPSGASTCTSQNREECKKPCATDCLHFNQELGFGAAWAAHRTQKNIVFVLDVGKSLNAEGKRIKTKLSRNMTKHALEESG